MDAHLFLKPFLIYSNMESKQTYLNTYLSFKSSEYRIYQKNIQRLKDEKWTVVSDDFSIDKTIRTIMFKRPL